MNQAGIEIVCVCVCMCVCVCVCVCAQSLSHVRHLATPQTIALQAPLAMEFPRQEYWNGLLFPSLWNLPDPAIKFAFLASPALAGRFFTTAPRGKP